MAEASPADAELESLASAAKDSSAVKTEAVTAVLVVMSVASCTADEKS
jgi:hypothetical protein